MRYLFICLLFVVSSFKSADPDEALTKANRICGKWESAEKNLTVEVYAYKNTFRAKIIRFTGGVTPAKPMETITDINNPDQTLRNRKVLGLNVVEGLTYKSSSDTWENGKIYEVQSGKYWNAAASLGKDGLLKVKGYWHVKLLGKTMIFRRIN